MSVRSLVAPGSCAISRSSFGGADDVGAGFVAVCVGLSSATLSSSEPPEKRNHAPTPSPASRTTAAMMPAIFLPLPDDVSNDSGPWPVSSVWVGGVSGGNSEPPHGGLWSAWGAFHGCAGCWNPAAGDAGPGCWNPAAGEAGPGCWNPAAGETGPGCCGYCGG